MNWEAFFDQTWVQVLLTVLGMIAGAAASIAWATSNAERLGRIVGRKTPGDGIDRFLVSFAQGFAKGLEETYTEASVALMTQPVSGAAAQAGVKSVYRIEVKTTPMEGKP